MQEIILIAGHPVHQEALRIVAHGVQPHTGQSILSAAHSRHQFRFCNRSGSHAQSQALVPHFTHGGRYRGIGPLVHIQVFRRSQLCAQVAAPVVARLLHQFHRLPAAVLIGFAVMIQQVSAGGSEILLPLRHAGRHKARSRLRGHAGQFRQCRTVNGKTQCLADLLILQPVAVEENRIGFQHRLRLPVLVCRLHFSHLFLAQRPERVHYALIIQDLRRSGVPEAEGQLRGAGKFLAVSRVLPQYQ